MKYYIIAGEASGDLHGSNLIRALKKKDTAAEIVCWGGDLMQAAGATVVKHYRDLAFMGFIEVIKNLPTIFANLRFCKEDIKRVQPDVLILVDYPGFNLRIAEWAKKEGYRIIYYISPQVWAWKESRVKLIRKVVDKMIVILPFEKDFYHGWEYKVDYVGHPLVEVIDDFQQQHPQKLSYDKPVIALLPGSRKQEILAKLPVMLEASKAFPQHQFVVAKASSLPDDFYAPLMETYPLVKSVRNETYTLLASAVAALVTSGTATLETALFGVPQVVCYKGSVVSYHIAKRLIKIKYISLVNLIMDKAVVRELIQQELTVTNLEKELSKLLFNRTRIEEIRKDYTDLRELLRKGGRASEQAASIIMDFLHDPPLSVTKLDH